MRKIWEKSTLLWHQKYISMQCFLFPWLFNVLIGLKMPGLVFCHKSTQLSENFCSLFIFIDASDIQPLLVHWTKCTMHNLILLLESPCPSVTFFTPSVGVSVSVSVRWHSPGTRAPHHCEGHTAWPPERRKGRSQAGPKGHQKPLVKYNLPSPCINVNILHFHGVPFTDNAYCIM